MIPLKAAGMRTGPPPSVPADSGAMPSATAAAVPPLEPPLVLVGSHGFPVLPVSGLSVTPFQPNSGLVVLPTNTAPASRRRATDGASSFHSLSAEISFDPRRVGQPSVSSRSLMLVGTPSRSPAGLPATQRASDARAWASADSSSTRQYAFT